MNNSFQLIDLLSRVQAAGVAGDAPAKLHLICFIVGIAALGTFLCGLEVLRRMRPGTFCWERFAYLAGRILIHAGWMYGILIFYPRCWRHFNVPKALGYEYVVLLLIALWWVFRHRIKNVRSPFLLPGGFFAAIIVIMCLFAVNMAEGWEDMMKFALGISLAVIAPYFVHRLQDLHLFGFLIAIVSIVVALYGLGQYWDWPICYHFPIFNNFAEFKEFLHGFWQLLTGEHFQIVVPALEKYADLRRSLDPNATGNIQTLVTQYWTQMHPDLFTLVLQQKLGMVPMKFINEPVSYMGNKNYTAEFINLALPICVCMLFYNWGRPLKMALFAFASMINLLVLIYADCNATYVGLAATLPLVFFILLFSRIVPGIYRARLFPSVSHETMHTWARTGTILCILVGAIFSAVVASTDNPLRNKITGKLSWVDLDDPPDFKPDGAAPQIFRLECMDSALRTIAYTFPLGVGPGNFKIIHPLFENQLERKVLGEETLARKVHNDFLNTALCFGAVGMFCFLWLLTMAYFLAFRTFGTLNTEEIQGISNRRGPPLTAGNRRLAFYMMLGCLAGINVSLFSCNFGHTFWIPGSMGLMYLFIGLTAAIHARVHFPQPLWKKEREAANADLAEDNENFTSKLRARYEAAPGILRWVIVFALILPLGVQGTRQLVGESLLKSAMSQKDLDAYGNLHYKEMLKNISKAEAVWPYQMEIYYIMGRYCIDAFQMIDAAARGSNLPGVRYPGTRIQQAAQEAGIPYEQVWHLALEQFYEIKAEEMPLWLLRGVRVLQRDLFMNPNYKWAHNNLGVLYEKIFLNEQLSSLLKKQFGQDYGDDLSFRSYKRTLRIDDEQIYGLYNTGLGYMRDEKFQEAIEPFERALSVDPQRTENYLYIAHCYTGTGHYELGFLALERFGKLTRMIDPENPNGPWNLRSVTSTALQSALQIYNQLARNFFVVGDYKMAVRAYRRLLQGDPDFDNIEDLYFYGRALASPEVNDPASAAVYLQRVFDSGTDKTNYVELALRYYVIALSADFKNLEKVRDALQRLSEICPKDPNIWYNLAAVKAQIPGQDVKDIADNLAQVLNIDLAGMAPKLLEDPKFQGLYKQFPYIKETIEQLLEQRQAPKQN